MGPAGPTAHLTNTIVFIVTVAIAIAFQLLLQLVELILPSKSFEAFSSYQIWLIDELDIEEIGK